MGVLGMARSSSISSSSGLDRSTSGLGLSSRRLSRSESSAELDAALDGLGEMMLRPCLTSAGDAAAAVAAPAPAAWAGSGSGLCGHVVR